MVIGHSSRALWGKNLSVLMVKIALASFLTMTMLEAQAVNDITAVIFNKTFSRSNGQPETNTETFSLPSQVHGPFRLTVVNGNAAGQDRVSSASIVLNGNQVLGPSDLNQNVGTVERTVLISPNNTFAVQLQSKPGSFLKISITGNLSEHTVILSSTQQIGISGGTVALPAVGAELAIPADAIPSSTSVQLATIDAPLIDLLASQATEFRLLTLPKLQVSSSALFKNPVGIKLSRADIRSMIPSSETLVFVALVRNASPDEPDSFRLIQMGGLTCGNDDAVCLLLSPGWFDTLDPLDPTRLVIQFAAASKPSTSGASGGTLKARADRSASVLSDSVPATQPTLSSSSALWQSESTSQPASVNGVIEVLISDTVTILTHFELRAKLDTGSGSSFLPINNVLIPFQPRPACLNDDLVDLGYTCITSRYTFRPQFQRRHYGVDLSTRIQVGQTAVPSDGFLVLGAVEGAAGLTRDDCGGNHVIIQHDSTLQTSYFHLQAGLGNFPRIAPKGDPVGLSDNDGTCTRGPHLHFEAKIDGQHVDPEPLLRNNLNLYFPYRLCLGVDDEKVGCSIDLNQTVTDISIEFVPSELSSDSSRRIADGQIHTLWLQLMSVDCDQCPPRLGPGRKLQEWKVRVSGIDHVEITPVSPSVAVGQTVQLVAAAKDASGNTVPIPPTNFMWSSVNPGLATVDTTGLVRGVTAGTTQINVTESSSGKSANVVLTVIGIDHIDVTPFSPSVAVGQTVQLVAAAKDASGNTIPVPSTNFTWSSVNPALATVDTTGLVRGVAAGTTQINVTESSSGKSANVVVTVIGAGIAVRVNPFGMHSISDGPFQIEVVSLVNGQLTSTAAPADITVTLLREVISQCSGLLFSSNRTVAISQGQVFGGSLDAAGRDPACNTLSIMTRWTVLQAVETPNINLSLSIVPPAQLSVAIVR